MHRIKKHHHAGLHRALAEPERVKQLLEDYSAEFAQMFLASMPPRSDPPRKPCRTLMAEQMDRVPQAGTRPISIPKGDAMNLTAGAPRS